MKALIRTKLEHLAVVHEPYCISIYIPIDQTDHGLLGQKRSIELKNRIKSVKEGLKEQGLDVMGIEGKISRIETVYDSPAFLKSKSKGLAIFSSEGIFETIYLPFAPKAFEYVNTNFYLKPLIWMLSEAYSFYVLSLEINKIRLFKVDNDGISEVFKEGIAPLLVEDTIGLKEYQNHLHFRSTQNTHKGSISYGSGEGKEHRHAETQTFFKAIDHRVSKYLYLKNKMVVLTGLDYLCAIYKKINTYRGLFDLYLPTHPSEENLMELRAKALALLETELAQDLHRKMELFKTLEHTSRTSVDKETILQAIFKKNVDTLFLKQSEDTWGTYNPETQHLNIANNTMVPNVSLSNLATVQLFLQGKHVYGLNTDDMPNAHADWNAIFSK